MRFDAAAKKNNKRSAFFMGRSVESLLDEASVLFRVPKIDLTYRVLSVEKLNFAFSLFMRPVTWIEVWKKDDGMVQPTKRPAPALKSESVLPLPPSPKKFENIEEGLIVKNYAHDGLPEHLCVLYNEAIRGNHILFPGEPPATPVATDNGFDLIERLLSLPSIPDMKAMLSNTSYENFEELRNAYFAALPHVKTFMKDLLN